MRKEKLIKLTLTRTKSPTGASQNSYVENGFIWTDYVLPLGQNSLRDRTIQDWGFDPYTTRKTLTRSPVEENTFVKWKGKVYHIERLVPFPRHAELFLTEVKANG